MNVTDLLDAAKRGCHIETDAGLAERLAVTKQAVSRWRLGQAMPEPVACEKLANFSGLPLNKVLGIVGEARAISTAEKRVWRKLAAAVLAVGVLIPTGAFAQKNSDERHVGDYLLCELLVL